MTDADPTRYEAECHRCGATVDAFTRECPGCGFRRDSFEEPVDPEVACIECGEEAHNYRCGCCSLPLCSKHRELGGGFCSTFFSVGGVGVCPRSTVHVGVWPTEASVLVVPESETDADVFHLPVEEGATAPACRPREAGKVTVSLKAAREDLDRTLCTHCGKTARKRQGEQVASEERIEVADS